MKDKEVLLTVFAMAVLAVFLGLSLQSGVIVMLALAVGTVILLACGLHMIIKSAVKAALREYEEEKAKANGQE